MQNEDYSHTLDSGFGRQVTLTEGDLYSVNGGSIEDLFITLLYNVEDSMRMHIDKCYWVTHTRPRRWSLLRCDV